MSKNKINKVISTLLSTTIVLGCGMFPNTNFLSIQAVYALENDDSDVVYIDSFDIKKDIIKKLRENKEYENMSDYANITKGHLRSLKSLSVKIRYSMPKLSFLDYCTNLTRLNIYREDAEDSVKDLSNVGKLTNLVDLNCNAGKTDDMKWLNNLSNLKYLALQIDESFNLEHINNLGDLTFLKIIAKGISHQENWKNISTERLVISDVSKIDTREFSKIKKLNCLHLYKIQNIKNIEFLNKVNGIHYVDLIHTSVSDLSSIASGDNIRGIRLVSNPITDISGLKNLNRNSINHIDHIDYDTKYSHIYLDARGDVIKVPDIIEQDGSKVPVKIEDEYKDDIEKIDDNTFRLVKKEGNKILEIPNEIGSHGMKPIYNVLYWTSEDGQYKDRAFNGKIFLVFNEYKSYNNAETQTENNTSEISIQTDNHTKEVSIQIEKHTVDMESQTETNKVDILVGDDKRINNRQDEGINTDNIETNTSDVNTQMDNQDRKNISVQTETTSSDKVIQTEKNVSDKEVQTDLGGKDIDRLKIENERLKVPERDVEKGNKVASELENLKNELIRLSEKNQLELPKGIEVGQWYPDYIYRLPDKKSYIDGEDIVFNGMQMIFSRYVLNGNRYEKQTEVVNYREYRSGYRGWIFNVKTPKALLKNSEGNKMRVKFSFTLSNNNESR